MSYSERIANARARLAEDEPREAFGELAETLRFPAMELLKTERFTESMQLFAEIATRVADAKFGQVIARIAEAPDDPRALYEAGYEMIEQGLHPLAATVLARANRIAPGEEAIIFELCVALEQEAWNAEARDLLLRNPQVVEGGFLGRYLLVFHSVLAGDLATAREHAGELQAGENADYQYMESVVRGMLERAALIEGVSPLDETDLRGWHFIANGTVVLHLAQEGARAMHGRYAWVQDSFSRCREGLVKLGRFLERAGFRMQRIVYLPDRDSEVLGMAAAQILPGASSGEARPLDGPEDPELDEADLVIAYDLSDIEDPGFFEALRKRRPGQVLFAHNCNWTVDFPLAPDACTILSQFNTAPWAAQLRIDSESGEPTETEPRSESPEELAREIESAELNDEDMEAADLERVDAFADALRDLLLGPARSNKNERPRQVIGNPVKSNRFGGI